MKKRIFISPILELNKYKKLELKIQHDLLKKIVELNFDVSTGYFLEKKNIERAVYLSDGIILAGGGDISQISKKKVNLLRDIFEKKLLKFALKLKKPIMGICRGSQLLASFYNGVLINKKNHVRTSHPLKLLSKEIESVKIKKLTVNSFHNYCIKSINEKKFKVLAKSLDNNIEIYSSKKDKILCFMFHPERENISQKNINKIILNFFK